MAKYCSICGQLCDDSAVSCAVCGTPFGKTHAPSDDAVTVAADDAYASRGGASYQQPSPAPYQQPSPAPYQQPSPAPYQQPSPAPYQQPSPAPYQQPSPAPYQQPSPTAYQQPQAPDASRQQVGVAYGGQTPRDYAQPVNMTQTRYGVPVQGNAYQPAPEKKNRSMVIGISVVVGIVVLIAAIVVTIILVSKNVGSGSGSGSGSVSLQGAYYLNSQNDHGTNISRETLNHIFGGDMILTVGSDNTGTISEPGGETMPISFNTKDKTVSFSGSSGTYSLDGNRLTITVDDGNVINEFIRQ